MTNALVASALTKVYRRGDRDHIALNALDLEIGSGESVGVIGPNGAGKTTLLRLAAGVTAPSAGRVTRCEKAVAVLELGLGLQPDLSGAENLEFAAPLLGMPRRHLASVRAEIIEFSGLGDALDRPVKGYSAGMYARLSLALALYVDADLFMLDEVLSVGDTSFRRRVGERLRSLNSDGRTVVVVSHDLSLVNEVCDRAIRIDAGMVVDDGVAPEVTRRYRGEVDQPRSGAIALEREATIGPIHAVQPDWAEVSLRVERPVGNEAKLDLEVFGVGDITGTVSVEERAFMGAHVDLSPSGQPTETIRLRFDTAYLWDGVFLVRFTLRCGGDQAFVSVPLRVSGVPAVRRSGILGGSWRRVS